MPEETLEPKPTNEAPPEPAEQAEGQAEAADARGAEPEAPPPSPEPAQAPDQPDEAAPETDEAAQPAAEEEQPQEPDYGVEVEDAGTLRKKVTVTVPVEKINAKRDEMFGELMASAQVPGFRIGRAPRRLVEKRFGREVSRDVRNAVIGESLGSSLEQSDLRPLGAPEIDLDAIELPEQGDMSYSYEVEVSPEFDLPELKGIPVKEAKLEVTDERVDEALERMRISQARYEATDEPAADHDLVEATARIRGEGLGEMVQAVSLRVAPGQIEGLPLVDLGKQLSGRKPGETVTLTARASEAHPNEDWHGKEISIELAIQQVRRRALPEVNEEYARAAGFDALAELREALAVRMQARIRVEARRAMHEQVRSHLLEKTDFDLPEGALARQTARVFQRRYLHLLQQGIPREEIDERMAEIRAAASEEAKRELKLSLILRRIADDREIEVTEEEINSNVAAIASQYGRRPERFRQELANEGILAELQEAVRDDKVLDSLLADAKTTEVTPESLAEAEQDEGSPPAPADAEDSGPAEAKDEADDDGETGEAEPPRPDSSAEAR